jgi:hypothetical protein
MSSIRARSSASVGIGDACIVGGIAGLTGGVAEIGWITLYQHLVGHDAVTVALGVTKTVMPGLASGPAGLTMGLTIHIVLSIALGVAVGTAIPRLLPSVAGTALEPVVVIAALVGAWAMNFLVVLPVINPEFVALVPYGVSLGSKVLFGFAAAFVFWCVRQRAVGGQELRGDIPCPRK